MRPLFDPAVTSKTAQERADERERHELVGSMKRVADMDGEAKPEERVLTTHVKIEDRPRRAKHLKNLKRQTPLHQAVLEGNLYSVRLLLELGANVDAKDATQYTAIHYATRHGYKEIVETLLAAGARYEAVVKDKWTALHIAAHKGYTEITQLLLDAGANKEKTTAYGSTALHLATNCGRTEVVRILLEGGADVDAVGPVGLTPLHIAASNGDLFVIQVLLDAKAKLEVRSPQGTAWQLASKTGDKEILEALVAAGAQSTFMARSVTPGSPITDGTVSG